MKFRKGAMLTFMTKHNIPVPSPVPTKPVWILKIKDNIVPI